jgi:hypothetical protein
MLRPPVAMARDDHGINARSPEPAMAFAQLFGLGHNPILLQLWSF